MLTKNVAINRLQEPLETCDEDVGARIKEETERIESFINSPILVNLIIRNIIYYHYYHYLNPIIPELMLAQGITICVF